MHRLDHLLDRRICLKEVADFFFKNQIGLLHVAGRRPLVKKLIARMGVVVRLSYELFGEHVAMCLQRQDFCFLV